MRRIEEPGGARNVDARDRRSIARRKRVVRRAVHEVPAALERALEKARVVEIAGDDLAAFEQQTPARKRANAVTGTRKRAHDVRADETGRAGYEDEISLRQALRESIL